MTIRFAGILTIVVCFACWPTFAAAQQPEPATSAPVDEILAPVDPAVAAIVASKPETPAERVQAAKTLFDLNHADVAKQFLKQVIDAKLSPEQLAELGQHFGAAMFLDMASRPALQPEGKQLAEAVLSARKARLEDSNRIDELIQQLQDPDEQKRIVALAGLQEAPRAAVGPLVAVLNDPARANEFANVRTVLASMGSVSRAPLLAVLQSNDPKLTVQAILALEEMNSRKVVLPLLGFSVSDTVDSEVRRAAADAIRRLTGRTPTRAEAIALLADAAKKYFDRREPVEGVVDGRVELWRWDADKRQCVAEVATAEDAARRLAAQFSRAAFELDGKQHELLLLFLATMLDEAAYANGLDRPWDANNAASAEAKRFGAKELDGVLAFAISHGHPAAATVAAHLLGEIGTATELLYQGDRPSPLALALQDPDRRVRMAALRAIVRLQPTKAYAGSSYVPAALGYFAVSSGVRRAIVASSNIEQSRDMAGMLAAAGLQTDTANTGAEFVRMAARSPDYELAYIDVSIRHPEIASVLQSLRRDPRTATLRVGLQARAGLSELAERLAESDPMTKAFARPHDEQAIRWQLQQLGELGRQEFVDFATRQRQASESLDLLAELSRSPVKLYDLQSVQESVLAALYNPALAIKATGILAEWNSPAIQRALVAVASRYSEALPLRQAAVEALRKNVETFGILLTTAEIRQQYRRYNESRLQDEATQRILGLILDCLEAPSGASSRHSAPVQTP